MSEITKYALVDQYGADSDFEYDTFAEAKELAGKTHGVIARTYVYDDSELVWTPDGSGTWPPKSDDEEGGA